MEQFNVGFALWFIKHKKLIHFTIIVVLLAVIAVIWIYVGTFFIAYVRGPKPQDPDILVKLPYQPGFADDVEVLTTALLPATAGYNLVAHIHNPNDNEGTSLLEYRFALMDASGNLVGEVKGVTFILPQQSRYIIKTNVNFQDTAVARVGFEVLSYRWIRRRSIIDPRFQTLDHLTRLEPNDLGRLELFAVIQNNSLYNFMEVEVGTVLLDASGVIVGVNYTTLENFYAQSRREIRMLWPKSIEDSAQQVIIDVGTNIYNGANFVRPENDDGDEESPEYRDI